MKYKIDAKLTEFYGDEIPGYVEKAGKSYITIRFGHDWDGSIKPRKIRIKDVIGYYKNWAHNISSGCRAIAGFSSDWRCIDNLAKESLEWFKLVNMKGLKRECLKAGLDPRF